MVVGIWQILIWDLQNPAAPNVYTPGQVNTIQFESWRILNPVDVNLLITMNLSSRENRASGENGLSRHGSTGDAPDDGHHLCCVES
jgi:hypothetical protein